MPKLMNFDRQFMIWSLAQIKTNESDSINKKFKFDLDIDLALRP